ncbi:MAG: hypothetical protein KJ890_07095 [Gammaproteobacteria bacterium]|nr:hypothetical protein [Gammaproteobacteria bacterium]MBU1805216.1 hypothetical protein [Gammaproteobacteria bacterium]
MNVYGLKILSQNGATIIDPDDYTVRMVESRIYGGGIVTENDPRYYQVAMSPAVRAGMFAVVCPLYAIPEGMRMFGFGEGNQWVEWEAALPLATVYDGYVMLDRGSVRGWTTLNVAVYVLAKE